MEWKKSKLTRWQAGPFTITEEATASNRPYRLDGPDDQPRYFETLTEAKAHASTLNELNLQREEVARLRAELDELRHPDRWPDVDVSHLAEVAGEEEEVYTEAILDDDDGRGIPQLNGHATTLKF